MSHYLLCDASRFYASSASAFSPELRTKPIVVTTHSGFQGVPIAVSKAASKLNIEKFKPLWETGAQEKIEQAGGRVVSANFNTLGHSSKRFMRSVINAAHSGVEHYIPHMVYSVDEIWLDCSALFGIDLVGYVTNIRKRVWQEQRIGTGVAMVPTLTLCKVASYAAKRLPGYNGICILHSAAYLETRNILSQTPLSSVWGIGSRRTEHLTRYGITTAEQLRKMDVKKAQKEFGITLANTINELNGIPVLELDTKQSAVASRPKNDRIYSTKSYNERLVSHEEIATQLAHHCEVVCEKARAQGAEITKLHVYVSTSGFDKDKGIKPFFREKEAKFEPTSDSSVLLKLIKGMHCTLISRDPITQPIYKVGVGATRLTHEQNRQYDLFAPAMPNNRPLMDAIDTLNSRYGRHSLTFARSTGAVTRQSGELHKQTEHRLPNYFTRLKTYQPLAVSIRLRKKKK